MKVEIQGSRDQSVCKMMVDGENLFQRLEVTKLTFTVDANGVPRVVLELQPDEVVVEADVEIEIN